MKSMEAQQIGASFYHNAARGTRMKRQKRDMMERAFQRGYKAGSEGKSKEMCPKPNGPEHQQWINGWREGRQDHWDGYTGVNGLHRVNEVVIHQ